MTTEYIEYRKDEQGRKFPFVDVGCEDHGRPSFRLWVSGRLIQKDADGNSTIEIPVQNARIERTAKGSYVLRPHDGSTVYDIFVPCGYRGEASFEILDPKIPEEDIFEYSEYRSERGNLGIDEGAIVNCPSNVPLKYRWERSGRLYGEPCEGVTIITPDGTEHEIDMIPDGLEAIEELPTVEAEQFT